MTFETELVDERDLELIDGFLQTPVTGQAMLIFKAVD